jgi:hypothetical protein
MMTATFTKDWLDSFLQMLRDRGMNEFGISCVDAMFGLKQRYLEAAFDLIDSRFGGIDAYLEQEMRLTKKLRAQLKALYCA